jgi:hypothetical protein
MRKQNWVSVFWIQPIKICPFIVSVQDIYRNMGIQLWVNGSMRVHKWILWLVHASFQLLAAVTKMSITLYWEVQIMSRLIDLKVDLKTLHPLIKHCLTLCILPIMIFEIRTMVSDCIPMQRWWTTILFMHTIGFLVQTSRDLNPSSSHAGSHTPSFLRTMEQEFKSIGSFNINWLLNIRLVFTWEWISFSNCLALLLVIGPAISSIVSFGD